MQRHLWLTVTDSLTTQLLALQRRFQERGGELEGYTPAAPSADDGSPSPQSRTMLVFAMLDSIPATAQPWLDWLAFANTHGWPEDPEAPALADWYRAASEDFAALVTGETAAPAAPARDSLEEMLENQRRYGNMVTRRQQEAARMRRQRRAEEAAKEPSFKIDWNSDAVWRTEQYEYPIAEMQNEHLWQTLIWLVRSVVLLHSQYATIPDHLPAELAAKQWLARQTLFRALLQEAIRRRMSFPDDVYHVIKAYVLKNRPGTPTSYEPWRDPTATAAQAGALAAFLDEPLEAAEFGKALRVIEI